jgi:hypothetical protein
MAFTRLDSSHRPVKLKSIFHVEARWNSENHALLETLVNPADQHYTRALLGRPKKPFCSPKIQPLLFHNDRYQTLGVLDIDGLDVAVELLGGTLLVVSAAADAHAESVGHTLDTLLPHLLVQLGVETDVLSLLQKNSMSVFRVLVPREQAVGS